MFNHILIIFLDDGFYFFTNYKNRMFYSSNPAALNYTSSICVFSLILGLI